VDLPAGASILTAEVAGEKVKPVLGADGSQVPLLRAGFRPTDAYMVSFVFLHAGAPFAKKGDAELVLPKMDLPIARVEWEVFLPDQYKVADFGGDALPARLLTLSPTNEEIPPQVIYAEAGELPEQKGHAGGYESRQPSRRDRLEREPCAYLSDTRVVRLDMRVIAEVGIRYADVRGAEDHVVERIH
jgi:hypothetical protein